MFAIKYYGSNERKQLPPNYVVEHKWIEDNDDLPNGYHEKLSAKGFEELMSRQDEKLNEHRELIRAEEKKSNAEREKKQKEENEAIEAEKNRQKELEDTQKEIEKKRKESLKKLLVDAKLALEDSNYESCLQNVLKFLEEVTK
jgi:hypothetical protein